MGGKDKWGILVVLLILGVVGYQKLTYQSPMEPVYEKWSQAVAGGDCATLRTMAEGNAADWVENFCSQQQNETGNSQEAADRTADINIPVSPAEKKLDVARDMKSQTTNPDGTITLVSEETSLPIPGSLERIPPPQMVTLKLKKEKDGWKVVDYQSKSL